jgi:hypothetical protein
MNIGVPKNLTAVEWLQAEFNKWAEGRVFIPQNILEQAKAMEKEHLMMAFNDGIVNSVINKKSSEQYYNITYNK